MKENLRRLTTLAGLVTVGHVVGCSSAVSPDLSDDPTPVFMPSADAIAFGQLEVQWAPSGSGQALRQIREQKTLPDDVASSTGSTLVLSIRDIGRPGLQCSMASGDCAGIRLNSTGELRNRLILDFGQGETSFWLREGGVLSLQPEPG